MIRQSLMVADRLALRAIVTGAVLTFAWLGQGERWILPATGGQRIHLLSPSWPIGDTARYRRVVDKRRDCRLEIEHSFEDRTGLQVSYATGLRRQGKTGSTVDTVVAVAVPRQLQPGRGWFRATLRYWCNELWPQVYRSNRLAVRFIRPQP